MEQYIGAIFAGGIALFVIMAGASNKEEGRGLTLVGLFLIGALIFALISPFLGDLLAIV